MIGYYKLIRKEEILSQLDNRRLQNRKWQDQLNDKLQVFYYDMCGMPGTHLPVYPVRLGIFGRSTSDKTPPFFIFKDIMQKRHEEGLFTSIKLPELSKQTLLVCNLDKISSDTRDRLLATIGVLPELPSQTENVNIDSLFGAFSTENDSMIIVSPEYISKNFPLTYPEEMIYNSIFVKHPLVGYEKMLVPLEKYYKFLSEQSFNELLAILVKLGVKKVELIHSENKLMKNALDAYAGYKNITGISATYKESASSSIHAYWGMEFEGKQISPNEIGGDFLHNYPFHRNNGTLLAMIEGIKYGNRNKVYTVERSFSGSYGLEINSAIKVLGFKAGFDFNKETYLDEKSTFNVLY